MSKNNKNKVKKTDFKAKLNKISEVLNKSLSEYLKYTEEFLENSEDMLIKEFLALIGLEEEMENISLEEFKDVLSDCDFKFKEIEYGFNEDDDELIGIDVEIFSFLFVNGWFGFAGIQEKYVKTFEFNPELFE